MISQTYFGALDGLKSKLLPKTDKIANSESTIKFIKHIQANDSETQIFDKTVMPSLGKENFTRDNGEDQSPDAQVFFVDNVRTVSDTKRNFYNFHTRPINSIYRRFVEELMVEMHLLSVNTDFQYDPIFALGVITSFEGFMKGYEPNVDKDSIFSALCQSVGGDSAQYRQDASQVLQLAKESSVKSLLGKAEIDGNTNSLLTTLKQCTDKNNFKYSRLFAIGLYTILAEADASLLEEAKQRNETLKDLSSLLNLPSEKFQKDLDLYLSNLEKMKQLLVALEESLAADRKKRDKSSSTETTATETEQDS